MTTVRDVVNNLIEALSREQELDGVVVTRSLNNVYPIEKSGVVAEVVAIACSYLQSQLVPIWISWVLARDVLKEPDLESLVQVSSGSTESNNDAQNESHIPAEPSGSPQETDIVEYEGKKLTSTTLTALVKNSLLTLCHRLRDSDAATGWPSELRGCLEDPESSAALPHQFYSLPFVAHSIRGRGKRGNEDRFVALPKLSFILSTEPEGSTDDSFYAVFDGHNGNQCSQYATTHMIHHMASASKTCSNPESMFKSVFATVDDGFDRLCKSSPSCKSGSTAVCALYHTVSKTLDVAWAGDSAALIITESGCINLTPPHDLDNDDEIDRVTEAGAVILPVQGKARLQGALLVTRSLGDLQYKPPVSAEPEVVSRTIEPSDQFLLLVSNGSWDGVSNCVYYGDLQYKPPVSAEPEVVSRTIEPSDQFLLLASDGLWDGGLTDGEIGAMVREEASSAPHSCFSPTNSDETKENIAQRLIKKAKANDSTDDITVIVVDLRSCREHRSDPAHNGDA